MVEKIETDKISISDEIPGGGETGHDHPLVKSLVSKKGVPPDRSKAWFSALCISLQEDPVLKESDLIEKAINWLRFATAQKGF